MTDQPSEAKNTALAARCEELAEWEPCDCGCPSGKSPKSAKDVALIRAAAALRRRVDAAPLPEGRRAPDRFGSRVPSEALPPPTSWPTGASSPALPATATQAVPGVRMPLTDAQRVAIVGKWKGGNWACGDIIDAAEAAHGITWNEGSQHG